MKAPKVSYAVLRGEPTPAQRYLDTRLQHFTPAYSPASRAAPVQLPHFLYHCMRQDSNDICMINGATGEHFTNEQILQRAVPLARALIARGAGGTAVMCVMRNQEHLVALYYAALFAGAVPFLLDPQSTPLELNHFLPLVTPSLVACDADRLADVSAALAQYGRLAGDAVWPHDQLQHIAAGHDCNPGTFKPVPVARDARAVLLPTSGSTGLPKAAEITHSGLLAQLPSLWLHHERFPRPEQRAMFMSTAQWMTFTNMLTACPVFRITMLISPDKTLPTILHIMQTYQPTWVLLVPGTAAAVADAASAAQLSSLRTVVVTGAPCPPATLRRLQQLAPAARLANSYGMTEAQGFTALAGHHTPTSSIGKIFNIFRYKLMNEDGKEVAPGQNGELYLWGDCIIKQYVNNAEAYREGAAPGGWWRTGDVFYEDDHHHLFFVERMKFWFKYLNYHISPEELENVINSVESVKEVVVAGSERGAAAAVVLRPGAAPDRAAIHHAVDSVLIEYKRLRGGIAFVTSLPRTHSGKLHRADCTRLLHALVRDGECV